MISQNQQIIVFIDIGHPSSQFSIYQSHQANNFRHTQTAESEELPSEGGKTYIEQETETWLCEKLHEQPTCHRNRAAYFRTGE